MCIRRKRSNLRCTQKLRITGADSWDIVHKYAALRVVAHALYRKEHVACMDFLHDHLVLRERPRLIYRDDARLPQCLHGRETLHERVPLPHPPHAGRKDEGHDDRKTFGNDRDRERNDRREHLQERLPEEEADAKENRRAGEHDEHYHLREIAHVALERDLRLRSGDRLGNASHLRLLPRRNDERDTASCDDVCTLENHVGSCRQLFSLNRIRRLCDRDRFARKRCLVKAE